MDEPNPTPSRAWRITVRLAVAVPLTLFALGVARRIVAHLSRQPAGTLGLRAGRLSPCPVRFPCVMTQTGDRSQRMNPIPYAGTAAEAQDALVRVLRDLPRTRIMTKASHYIHAQVRSAVLHCIDDIEFYIDEAEGVIHFRSAARLPATDLGVNRWRMNRLQRLYRRFSHGN